MADAVKDGARGTGGDVYALETGDAGAARLRLLDVVYRAGTRQLLYDAGLRPGCHALDLACGVGRVSCWMAGEVGLDGHVVAADVNPDQLVVAKWHCAKCQNHEPIDYVEASAYETGFPSESFDLVHMRLLLCHLVEPAKVLAEALRLLKPGGALVCQDLHISSLYCFPESAAYARMIEHCLAMGRVLGVDYNYGLQLPVAAKQAGFSQVEVRLNQPAYLCGEEKRLWEHTFAEVAPAIARAGVASKTELDRLLAEMRAFADDENTLIAQGSLPGVIARK
jgi:ubiquinone/menaquinone biosynthesis C-methylase UbiE